MGRAEPVEETVVGRNEVLLVGRLAAAAVEREMPSGDVMVSWRLVVTRPPRRTGTDRRSPSVDTIECMTYAAAPRRSALSWAEGDLIEVSGALRRRFWRSGGGGAASRTEVEVARGRRLSPAVSRPRAAAAAPSAASA